MSKKHLAEAYTAHPNLEADLSCDFQNVTHHLVGLLYIYIYKLLYFTGSKSRETRVRHNAEETQFHKPNLYQTYQLAAVYSKIVPVSERDENLTNTVEKSSISNLYTFVFIVYIHG